ncbi:MAG: MotA/TolQ/ExbB proton channel family protein [Akkermansia sp.]|nr:MotA/TolQ/ExbB proton channel family protein [Akkermansia sp.]
MLEMIETMGPIAWLMIICAIGALAVVAERLFYFHRVNINAGDFLRGLSSLLRSGQYNEALHEVRLLPGPMARVVEAVLSRPKLTRNQLRDIALEAAELEVFRVERYIRSLLAGTTVLPLLGILGTILALVRFYEQPGITDGAAAMPEVAETLVQALLLSAMGIALAIPCYLFYTYLVARARKTINNIERAGLECVHIICDAREREAEAAAVAAPRTGTCRSGSCSLDKPVADEPAAEPANAE